MKHLGLRGLALALAAATMASSLSATSCSDGEEQDQKGQSPDAGNPVGPGPGEVCEWPPNPVYVKLTPQPARVVLAPGQKRTLKVLVQPDICVPTELLLTSASESIVASPGGVMLDFGTPTAIVQLEGKSLGTTTLEARIPRGDGTDATAQIDVEVMTAELPDCSGSGAGKVDDGTTLKGTGGLALASVGLQQGATQPIDPVSELWKAEAFDATIACGADQVPPGFVALGPAVTFGPANRRFQREIPFSVPIHPAAIPETASLRHVTLSYTGPRAKAPRVVPVANPRVVRETEGYALRFLAPWLGTYQAVADATGGTKKRMRHLTHRALIGVSMGGAGTAMFGLRNHQKFDVLAPLGGPVDWTWMLGHIERNHLGGFLPNDGPTPPAELAPMPLPSLPYEHPSTFDRWWYEYPNPGHGGSFTRADYVQIFRDLALMFGNPLGHNPAAGAENLPAGISPTDPSVVGDHPGRECAVWVQPYDGAPNQQKVEELAASCPKERCGHTSTLTGYYDRVFNPDGTYPVITVCDGSAQDPSLSPWANTWKPTGNEAPLELALAVDYDGDGTRDENEPIVSQGHERFDDFGADGLASKDEPGYQLDVDEDPAGDDWHPQYNPTGAEGNSRWDPGEPYDDHGLDGVPNTGSSPYDWGEGNGKFDYAPGYRTFLERDSRTVLERHPFGSHQAPLDDDALARLDLWTDGGTRDLFNFAVDAQALAGAWFARGRGVHYYNQTQNIPGQHPDDPKAFSAGLTDWSAVPGGVLLRYGKLDPTAKDIASGSGQHVGTADEIMRRIQSALYFIGSRWPDAPRTVSEASNLDPDPDAEACMVNGACDLEFQGRPVSVNFPPGYAHQANENTRYPVIYMLHGYGQTPEELKAAIIFLTNWMNFPGDSRATRLPKAILVYVDGRCRPGPTEAECIRGTFYTDSVRAGGPKIESYFLQLIDYVDSTFRTMAPSDVEWTE